MNVINKERKETQQDIKDWAIQEREKGINWKHQRYRDQKKREKKKKEKKEIQLRKDKQENQNQ